MELKDIKRVIEMMKQNELTEFELQDQDFRMSIKRGNGDNPIVMSSAPAQMMMHPAQVAAPAPVAAVPGEEAGAEADDTFEEIKSPMVGTFYRSPSPEAAAFASVGKEVDEDTVVCIIEAMKVMNEIKAETRGIIRKILVDNASPVEFGQPIFKVEPI